MWVHGLSFDPVSTAPDHPAVTPPVRRLDGQHRCKAIMITQYWIFVQLCQQTLRAKLFSDNCPNTARSKRSQAGIASPAFAVRSRTTCSDRARGSRLADRLDVGPIYASERLPSRTAVFARSLSCLQIGSRKRNSTTTPRVRRPYIPTPKENTGSAGL